MEFTREMQTDMDDDGDIHYDDDDNDDEDDNDPIMNLAGLGNRPSTLLVAEEDTSEDALNYPLHAAARENNIDALHQWLTVEKLAPDSLDSAGQTALHLAADRGHPTIIKCLYKAGADIHAADHDGISVLQAAVIAGNVDICKLLCQLGANPDQPDRDGDTPRNCAEDDPALQALMFRASQGQLVFELEDVDFQKELETLGRLPASPSPLSSLAAVVSVVDENQNGAAEDGDDAPPPPSMKDLQALDTTIEIELDDDGDMF
jgi:hypothetical protein